MEDILGFSEQIGVPRFVKKATAPVRAVVKRATPVPVKRQAVVVRRAATPVKRQAVVVKRAGVPIKRQDIKVKRTGVPVTRQAAVVRPTRFSTAQVPFKRAQAVVKKQQATSVVKRAEATRRPIPVRALTQVTSPVAVKNATPTQRSYMPVDLPYQTVQARKTAIRIPSTNFALPTNIDLIEPPVDAGITNYYGK